ncbi:hypothetical protein JVU11DRAFT_1914 [Chiua virens]|nr:hypothetical protein JVU11DRAFT_1914 [Chiua virens]
MRTVNGAAWKTATKEGLRTLPFSPSPRHRLALPRVMFNHVQACLSTGRRRHQIGPWVAAGYRVIVPDMLGFGKIDMPLEPSAYSTKRLCDDLAALLDHPGVQKAVSTSRNYFLVKYPQ